MPWAISDIHERGSCEKKKEHELRSDADDEAGYEIW